MTKTNLTLAIALLVSAAQFSFAAAPPPAEVPQVTTKKVKGTKVQESLYKSGNKEVLEYQDDERTPADKKLYDKDGKLINHCQYSLTGVLLFETSTSPEKRVFTTYNPQTGKKTFQRTVWPPRRDITETTFDAAGEPSIVISSGGCLRGLVSVHQRLKDGGSVNRMIRHDSMGVNVTDKIRMSRFHQEWRLDTKTGKFVLEKVENYQSPGKRVIVMAKDGHSVERVDFLKIAKVGWEVERSESADKLKPSDYSLLADPAPGFMEHYTPAKR